MPRPAAVVLLMLLGLGVAAQQSLACADMSASGGAHHCCEGADGGNGHPGPCDSPATLPDFACPQASCISGLAPALGTSLQTRQQFERLEFRPLDLVPVSPGLLTAAVDAAADRASVPAAAILKSETFFAAPAAYLRTLRLRL